MTLRLKFGVLIAVLAAIAVAIIGINIHAQMLVTNRFEDLTDHSAPAIVALGDANAAAARLREEASGVTLLIGIGADEDELTEDSGEVEDAYEDLLAAIEHYNAVSTLPDREAIVEEFIAESLIVYQAAHALIDAQTTGEPDLIEYKDNLENAENTFLIDAENAIAAETAQFERLHQETRDNVRTVQLLNWGSIGFGLVLVIAAAYVIVLQVIRPLTRLKESAIRLGQGNLDERVEVTSRDEIGVLAQQYNIMAANLRQRVQESEQMAQAATEANAFKTSLIARVSHELRSPLGAILGVGEMLIDGGLAGPLTEQQESLVTRIVNNSHDLTTLVNELLEQSRLDANRLELRERTYNPRATISHVLQNQEILASAKTVTLSQSVTPDLPLRLWGDPDRLEQIVTNLVHNAIKFTDTGSIHVEVTRPDPDHWAIAVRDTGIGIPLEAQHYIFDAFRQVDETATRQHNGLGLGLSIVQQITQAMHGTIMLESKVGQGRTFTVTIPLMLPQSEETREPEGIRISY